MLFYTCHYRNYFVQHNFFPVQLAAAHYHANFCINCLYVYDIRHNEIYSHVQNHQYTLLKSNFYTIIMQIAACLDGAQQRKIPAIFYEHVYRILRRHKAHS